MGKNAKNKTHIKTNEMQNRNYLHDFDTRVRKIGEKKFVNCTINFFLIVFQTFAPNFKQNK